MKKVSAKQRKLKAETDGIRRDPIEKFAVDCDCCEQPASECHEIVCGHGYRDKSMQNPRLLMWLCQEHHKEMQGQPYQNQIAAVVGAMVREVNRVRGYQAVDIEAVRPLLRRCKFCGLKSDRDFCSAECSRNYYGNEP